MPPSLNPKIFTLDAITKVTRETWNLLADLRGASPGDGQHWDELGSTTQNAVLRDNITLMSHMKTHGMLATDAPTPSSPPTPVGYVIACRDGSNIWVWVTGIIHKSCTAAREALEALENDPDNYTNSTAHTLTILTVYDEHPHT